MEGAGERAPHPQYGPIQLDLPSRTVRAIDSDTQEKLSPQQYQLLWLLVRAQGGMVQHKEIEDFLFSDRPDDKDLPLSPVVDAVLLQVRKKLKQVAADKIRIVNKHGFGFYLALDSTEDVTTV